MKTETFKNEVMKTPPQIFQIFEMVDINFCELVLSIELLERNIAYFALYLLWEFLVS